MKVSFYFLIFGSILITSCRNKIQEEPFNFSAEKAKKSETLIKMNTYVAKRNQELISQFVKRTGLNLKETGSGLWYGIYEKGQGKQVSEGDIVEIIYHLSLLDGTPVDSATTDKPKVIRTGKGGIEAGLEEGMELLHQGDHAWFILPPHMAYGNFGNQEKIPPGAFLFYDIYLVGVKPQK